MRGDGLLFNCRKAERNECLLIARAKVGDKDGDLLLVERGNRGIEMQWGFLSLSLSLFRLPNLRQVAWERYRNVGWPFFEQPLRVAEKALRFLAMCWDGLESVRRRS